MNREILQVQRIAAEAAADGRAFIVTRDGAFFLSAGRLEPLPPEFTGALHLILPIVWPSPLDAASGVHASVRWPRARGAFGLN